jgi:hypothetical protein
MRQGGRHEHPETLTQKRRALRTKPNQADWNAIGAQADQTQTRPRQGQNQTTYAKTKQTEEPQMIDKQNWWMEPTAVCPPQLSREKQQDAMVAEWAKSLPEKERKIVEGLPKLACEPHNTGQEKDAAEWNEASESPDMAEVMDKEHELLMERFGLREGQALGVAEWARKREHDAARSMQAKVLGAILGRFLGEKTADAKVVFWALAFQSGVARHLTRHNPHSKATELGVTRALMSYWQKEWQKELGLYDLTYAKTEEAREKYREARVAYVRKKKAATAA